MRARVIAMMITLAALMPVSAYSLTMQEAIDLALENNHALRQSQYEADAAKSAYKANIAPFYPALQASYAFADSNRDKAYGAYDSVSSLTLTAAYNLFNGFADLNTMKQYRAQAAAAAHMAVSKREDTILSAQGAYLDALLAKHQLESAAEAVQLLERHRHDTALYYREGLVAKNELLKVEVSLSSSRYDLVQAESGFRLAVMSLEQIIGRSLDLRPDAPADSPEALVDISDEPQRINADYGTLRGRMAESRSELKYMKLMRDSYGYAADASGGGYLPSVDLSYSHITYGESGTPSDRDVPYKDENVAAVKATWTFFSGMSTMHGMAAYRNQYRAAEQGVMDTEQQLELQLKDAMEGYSSALAKLDLARTTVSQAEEGYRVTDTRYRERVSTTTELLDARTELTAARTKYNAALYGLHRAVATLRRVVQAGLD